MQAKEKITGLRPFSEIQQLTSDAIEVKKGDPSEKYRMLEKIGAGGFGTVYKCIRKSDGYENALKHTDVSDTEKQSVINECSLINALNSENIVLFEEAYDHQNKIFVFLELMEGGDLGKIILSSHSVYSEAFCKYALYKVARGLQDMHRKNVLHRDIKSDNILCRPNGEIKIADLGLSVFLHE